MKNALSVLLVLSLTICTAFSLTACKKDKKDLSYSTEPIINETVSSQKKTSSKKASSKKASSKKASNQNTSSKKKEIASNDNKTENNIKSSKAQSTQSFKDVSSTVDYEDIECTTYTEYHDVNFLTVNSNKNLKMRFTLSLPTEWRIKKTDGGCNIIKNSEVIGTITSNINENKYNGAQCVLNNTGTYGNIDITHRIDSLGSGNNTYFLRTLSLFYNGADAVKQGVVIMVHYQEIDSLSVSQIISTATLSVTANDANIGAMKITDNRNRVLIMGNSFISTSKIGNILQTMCGSKLSVEAISRGYAKVNQYARDETIINNIKSGNYSAVFMCGFYISEDVPSFNVIKQACDSSNTQLAIFPAHNENRGLITSATVTYPEVKILDWKGEIQELINSGINSTHFCIQDSHLHSTPLAGYVGAHMIYRAIFGEIPQQRNYTDVSSQSIALLGTYSASGKVTHSSNSNVYLL